MKIITLRVEDWAKVLNATPFRDDSEDRIVSLWMRVDGMIDRRPLTDPIPVTLNEFETDIVDQAIAETGVSEPVPTPDPDDEVPN